jgi:hypothetical protein
MMEGPARLNGQSWNARHSGLNVILEFLCGGPRDVAAAMAQLVGQG